MWRFWNLYWFSEPNVLPSLYMYSKSVCVELFTLQLPAKYGLWVTTLQTPQNYMYKDL